MSLETECELSDEVWPSEGLWGGSRRGLLGVVGGVLRQRWLPAIPLPLALASLEAAAGVSVLRKNAAIDWNLKKKKLTSLFLVFNSKFIVNVKLKRQAINWARSWFLIQRQLLIGWAGDRVIDWKSACLPACPSCLPGHSCWVQSSAPISFPSAAWHTSWLVIARNWPFS